MSYIIGPLYCNTYFYIFCFCIFKVVNCSSKCVCIYKHKCLCVNTYILLWQIYRLLQILLGQNLCNLKIFCFGANFLNRMSWQTLHNISKINIRIKNQLKNEHATAYTNKIRKAKENDCVKISESYLHK